MQIEHDVQHLFFCCIKAGFVIPYSLDECVTAVLQVMVNGKNVQ